MNMFCILMGSLSQASAKNQAVNWTSDKNCHSNAGTVELTAIYFGNVTELAIKWHYGQAEWFCLLGVQSCSVQRYSRTCSDADVNDGFPIQRMTIDCSAVKRTYKLTVPDLHLSEQSGIAPWGISFRLADRTETNIVYRALDECKGKDLFKHVHVCVPQHVNKEFTSVF